MSIVESGKLSKLLQKQKLSEEAVVNYRYLFLSLSLFFLLFVHQKNGVAFSFKNAVVIEALFCLLATLKFVRLCFASYANFGVRRHVCPWGSIVLFLLFIHLCPEHREQTPRLLSFLVQHLCV